MGLESHHPFTALYTQPRPSVVIIGGSETRRSERYLFTVIRDGFSSFIASGENLKFVAFPTMKQGGGKFFFLYMGSNFFLR
ncbi:hypothetical protein WG66_004053, partial [Moniliophthora roreri]